jgi:hypothetical protein
MDFFLTYGQNPHLAAMKPVLLLVVFSMVLFAGTVSAQPTYKVVCDRSDNSVKIVPAEDRSPNLVPIRGGFPFFQIAERFVEENFPDRTCKPDEILKQGGTANETRVQGGQAGRSAGSGQTQVAGGTNQGRQGTSQRDTMAPAPAKQYKNYSLLLAGMVSNLGDPLDLDPPIFLGGGVGVEFLLGRRIYFGSGIHLNLLGGLIPDYPYGGDESYQWLYFLKTPVFAGIRTSPGTFSMKVEFGLAYSFEPQTVTPGWNMGGLAPASGSLAGITRFKAGLDVFEFEIGVERGITEMFPNYDVFRHQILYVGIRINF